MQQGLQIVSHLNEYARHLRPLTFARVSELICSQTDDPGTSKSPHEIQRETCISRRTVRRNMAKDGLKLKIFRRCEVQQLSDYGHMTQSQQFIDGAIE